MSKDFKKLLNEESTRLWSENKKYEELLDKNKITRNRTMYSEMDIGDMLPHFSANNQEESCRRMLQHENKYYRRLLDEHNIKGD